MPQRPPAEPPSPGRRRLLIAGGYVAAGAVALSRFGRSAFGHTGHRSDASPTTLAGQPGLHGSPTLPAGARRRRGAAGRRPRLRHRHQRRPGHRPRRPASTASPTSASTAAPSPPSAPSRSTAPRHHRRHQPGGVARASSTSCRTSPTPTAPASRSATASPPTSACTACNDVVASEFFDTYAAASCPVHFGGAFDDHWSATRSSASTWASGQPRPDRPARRRASSRSSTTAGIGIDFEPEYTPGVTFDEIKALAQVAKKHGVPCFFHGRYSSPVDQEHATVAEITAGRPKQTGARVHVDAHTSTGGTWHIQSALEPDPPGPRRGLRRHRLHVPLQLLGHLPRLGPVHHGGWQSTSASPTATSQIAGTVRAAHRGHVPGLPGAEQAGRGLRHPRGRSWSPR